LNDGDSITISLELFILLSCITNGIFSIDIYGNPVVLYFILSTYDVGTSNVLDLNGLPTFSIFFILLRNISQEEFTCESLSNGEN
jgi:hypothetical protein